MLTPTRQHQRQVPSALDLVLSDDEHSVNKLLVADSLGKSDHFMVEFEDEYVPTLSTFIRKHSEWMTKPVLHKTRL